MVDGLNRFANGYAEERSAGVPILMITAMGETHDKVSGFQLQAAMTTSTNPLILRVAARVKALLRRAAPPAFHQAQRDPQLWSSHLGA